jgi:hypothetical protein
MSDEIQVVAAFHKKRVCKHIAMVEGQTPTAPEHPKGRLPRFTRYMALAIYYEVLILQRHIHDYEEIATLGHVTRARVTQIVNLMLLAPFIQEQLLNLSRLESRRVEWSLRDFQSIAFEQDWRKQRERWNSISRL